LSQELKSTRLDKAIAVNFTKLDFILLFLIINCIM
jgi:hypothetical protein